MPMGFTLDDLQTLEVKVTIFDSKYLEKGNRYDVGSQRGLFRK